MVVVDGEEEESPLWIVRLDRLTGRHALLIDSWNGNE